MPSTRPAASGPGHGTDGVRFGNHRDGDEAGIDLVPLIDVVLVLVVFFVMTTSFDARSLLQLELPRASRQPDARQPAGLTVLVNADGRYFVNDQELLGTDIGQLKQALVQAAGSERGQTVLLRADARTPYQAVVTVQDALGQLGFTRIAIATT